MADEHCGYCLFPTKGGVCSECRTTWKPPLTFDQAKEICMEVDAQIARRALGPGGENDGPSK